GSVVLRPVGGGPERRGGGGKEGRPPPQGQVGRRSAHPRLRPRPARRSPHGQRSGGRTSPGNLQAVLGTRWAIARGSRARPAGLGEQAADDTGRPSLRRGT